ncbi:MAG: hypothetical protein OHK0023_06730 [Anaerolineae bacterium]
MAVKPLSDKPLAQRLLIKANYRVLLVNPPEGYLNRLVSLPEGVQITTEPNGEFDLIQFFASEKIVISRRVSSLLALVKPGGIFWVSYPKKTAKVDTDLDREVVWEAMQTTGWRAVTQISVDDTWSALRFRPESEGKKAAD